MGKFILCVSQHTTNNVLRYIHRLQKLKNLVLRYIHRLKKLKNLILLKTPVHFPEVQILRNLNFRLNPFLFPVCVGQFQNVDIEVFLYQDFTQLDFSYIG